VFVVEGHDLNAMDQRMTEFQVSKATGHLVKTVRYTLKMCDELLKLDEQRGNKLVDTHSK